MTIPTKFRDFFQEPSGVWATVTRHPDGCVLMFPRGHWALKEAEIHQWPLSARAWKRIFLGNAEDVEADGSGRVLIPQPLRRATGIDKEVVMMGQGSHFEIWDASALEKDEGQAVDAGLPGAIADFKF